MTDKARELLEWVVDVWGDDEEVIYANQDREALMNEIRAYLAEPEVNREQFSDDVVADSYFQVQPILGEYLKFKAGFRIAEKMHGIGGGE